MSATSAVRWNFFAPSRFDAALLSSLPWVSVFLSCAVLAMHGRRWFYTWSTLRPIPGPGTDWLPPLFLLSVYWQYRRHLSKSATSGEAICYDPLMEMHFNERLDQFRVY
ncbi:hypothetical protein MTO96_004729 [Rhipicephalus appendiculatus]